MEHNSKDLVVYLRELSPCMTLAQIGDKVGLTRERVRQLLKVSGLSTAAYRPPPPMVECLNCGKPTIHKMFCSSHCRWDYAHPLVECSECHHLFRRAKSQLSIKKPGEKLFCSQYCLGKYVGREFGFRRHPENRIPKTEDRVKAENLAQGESIVVWHPNLVCGFGKGKTGKYDCSIYQMVSHLNKWGDPLGRRFRLHHAAPHSAIITRIQ